jgi:hypothetical protein
VNRGPSFASCLAAIAVAANLDAKATKERDEARYVRRMEAWRTPPGRGSERRPNDGPKING